MKRLSLFLAAAATAAFGVAYAGIQEISSKAADTLAHYEPSGESRSCVMMRQIDSIKAADDRLLLVEMNDGSMFLNQPDGSCAGASRSNRRFEYRTSQPSLCAGDILNVVDNSGGYLSGSCSLGRFESLREKSPERPS
jgi:hypothetical protein